MDVARTPSWVAGALDALAERIPHWTFVSTISVYADHAHARRQPGHAAAAPADHRRRRAGHPGDVRREQGGVRAGRPGARPGGTGGPARADRGARRPQRPVQLLARAAGRGRRRCSHRSRPTATQVIDVRDLAAWIVTCAENRLTGVYDATGPVSSLGDLRRRGRRAVGGNATLVWAPADFLLEHDVDLLGRPAVAAAVAARGRARDDLARRERRLRRRPDHPADRRDRRDTLAWLRSTPDAHRAPASPAPRSRTSSTTGQHPRMT